MSESLDTEVMSSGSSNRQRLFALVALATVLIAFAFLYLIWASSRVDDDLNSRELRAQQLIDEFEQAQAEAEANATPTPVPAGPAPVATGPGEVLVVNRVPGDDYGRLAIRHADGSRTLLERPCLRVHVASSNGVCLGESTQFAGFYNTSFFVTDDLEADLRSYASVLPSRARVSPDGRFASSTGFISGSSYEDISVSSSTILTIDEIGGVESQVTGLDFDVIANDSRYENSDPQYWGVTFADSNEFYVTGFFEAHPEIMRGSLEDLTIAPTGWVGSCPSLSPDGKTLVFKEMRDEGGFDLVAVDLATQEKTLLSETRSVDDQIEWLDNDTILYALHPEGGDTAIQPEFDIWSLDIAPGSEPELFLPNADSPAVVR